MATHQEAWAGFPSEFDDGPALVTVDLGWADEGPDPRRTTLILVRLAAPDPEAAGEESVAAFLDELDSFDDALTSTLSKKLNAATVGMILTTSHRWWCYYASKGDNAAEIVATIARETAPEHTPEVMSEDDPEWDFYSDALFPDDAQLRFIADDNVVDQLQSNGDNAETPRPIEHYAYLPDPESRDRFAEWCEANGFTVTDVGQELNEEADAYVVQFNHVGPAITEEIWEKTMLASEAAEKLGGEYDGWESRVMKS